MADSGSSVVGGGSVNGGDEQPVPVWGNVPDGRRFIEEIHRSGDPDLRPYVDHRVVLPRKVGKAAQEQKYRGRALFATVMGDGPQVTAESLLGAMEVQCGVVQLTVKVQACAPPFHFFIEFDSEEDCTAVVMDSRELRCGQSWIKFIRWSIYAHDTFGKLEFKTTISIEGLPEEAWEPETVKMMVAGLDGELIEMLPTTDRWVLPLTAWLREPCAVPKMLILTVPLPATLRANPGSDEDGESPSPPTSPKEKRTRDYPLILHVKEVIDRGDLLAEDLDEKYLPDEGEDQTRRHTFKTWRGKIDDTGAGDHGFA
ncbi:unnamed protein product [Alopecurus aequalis]